MPKDYSKPINEADRQARAAFKAYADWLCREGPSYAFPIVVNPRTLERIVAGKRDVPPGLARNLAAHIRSEDMLIFRAREALEGWAMALELWAEDCQQRMEARHA